MKKLLLMLILPLAMVGQAQAKDSPFYLGLKAGLMDGGVGITDDALNAGFDLGYRFNRYVAGELEYTSTFIDGETRSGNDWEVDVLSMYAAFRTNTQVKLKGKIGFSHIDYGGNDDTEFSMGFGIGFWAAGGLMEIEYTKIDDNDDLDFISIGVNFFY